MAAAKKKCIKDEARLHLFGRWKDGQLEIMWATKPWKWDWNRDAKISKSTGINLARANFTSRSNADDMSQQFHWKKKLMRKKRRLEKWCKYGCGCSRMLLLYDFDISALVSWQVAQWKKTRSWKWSFCSIKATDYFFRTCSDSSGDFYPHFVYVVGLVAVWIFRADTVARISSLQALNYPAP